MFGVRIVTTCMRKSEQNTTRCPTMRSCFDSLVSHQNCTLYFYLFVSMFLAVEARAAHPPLLLAQGAASLHDRRAARVAVAISRARERLLG